MPAKKSRTHFVVVDAVAVVGVVGDAFDADSQLPRRTLLTNAAPNAFAE